MGRAVGREVVTLDTTLETLTDGRAGHVDLLTFREHFGLEGHAGLEFGNLFSFDMELFEHFACFDAGLSIVTGKRLAHARRLLRAECNLNVTRLFDTSSTVTGTDTPSSVKMRVMPILRPTMPSLSLIVFSTPAAIGRDRFHEKANWFLSSEPFGLKGAIVAVILRVCNSFCDFSCEAQLTV